MDERPPIPLVPELEDPAWKPVRAPAALTRLGSGPPLCLLMPFIYQLREPRCLVGKGFVWGIKLSSCLKVLLRV